ncbi:hypothetical protein SLS62_005465 [Diatrype stigma]|uniref:Uncharacterized protein n=1 Tax=Diatrype stigma TaxID=117547 RepID=A0AAN9USI2_9PEZI
MARTSRSKPTRNYVSYTLEDVKALTPRYRDLAIGGGDSEHLRLRAQDVFPQRYAAGMANLEEGILEHSCLNRLVLVDDTCHKLTPIQGLDYNKRHTGHASSRYQASRMELLRKDYEASTRWPRMSSWSNWAYRLFDRYIMPVIAGFDKLMVTLIVAGNIVKCLALNIVESKKPLLRRISYVMKPSSGNLGV